MGRPSPATPPSPNANALAMGRRPNSSAPPAPQARSFAPPKRDDSAQVALDLQDEDGESAYESSSRADEEAADGQRAMNVRRDSEAAKTAASRWTEAQRSRLSAFATRRRAEISNASFEVVDPKLHVERRNMLLDYYQRNGWSYEPGRDAVAFPFPER